MASYPLYRSVFTKVQLNDLAEYGVTVVAIKPSPNVTMGWRLVNGYHLSGQQNDGSRHLFIDTLDVSGKPLKRTLAWGWQGQRADEESKQPEYKEEPNRSLYDIPISLGQVVHVAVAGGASETVVGLHSAHGDRGGSGNGNGHHSFYLAFQWVSLIDDSQKPIKPTAPSSNHDYILARLDVIDRANEEIRAALG